MMQYSEEEKRILDIYRELNEENKKLLLDASDQLCNNDTNGYSVCRDMIKKLKAQGKIDAKEADRKIKIYDFLSTCNQEELYLLMDSGAFTDIIDTYIKIAVQNVCSEKYMQKAIQDEMHTLLKTEPAAKICKQKNKKS